ncbi:hypothetical protein KY289_036933 [Solanum tuberosum]|nr:hypothetical protein KY289_036933 [Solanum tuberosum]
MIVPEDKGITEVMVEVEAEAIVFIIEIVNNVKTMIIKADERGEVATTHSHGTSLKLNVTDATNSVIINQNAEQTCLSCVERNLILHKRRKKKSNHMSGQKEEFSELDKTFRGTVRFGDNSVVSAMGKREVLIEKETGSPLKVLRTDRGGEFNSQEFANFCEENGIKRQLTTAYTPPQNGVCERKNHTILNMVRNILTRSGVSKRFWPEAVDWSIHSLNRSPNFLCSKYDSGGGMKPTKTKCRLFQNLRINQSKAYKLYNPITKKIVISRDVIFDEDATWSWKDKGDQQLVPVAFKEETLQLENSNPI